MRIHRANVNDVPRIMECAREFTAQIPDCPLNEEHYGKIWQGFIESGNGVIFLLETVVSAALVNASDNGQIFRHSDSSPQVAGGIGGIAHPDLLTGKMVAVELFWYLKPEFRSGTWGVRLMKEFEIWAREKGCVHASMAHMECSMPERLKDFYVSQGYDKFETLYRKRL